MTVKSSHDRVDLRVCCKLHVSPEFSGPLPRLGNLRRRDFVVSTVELTVRDDEHNYFQVYMTYIYQNNCINE